MNGDGFVVTIFAQGDHENTPAEAIHHGLAHAHEAGFITAWSDAEPVSALRAKLAIAEKALEPFAAAVDGLHPEFPDDRPLEWASPPAGAYRRARAALTAIREGRE